MTASCVSGEIMARLTSASQSMYHGLKLTYGQVQAALERASVCLVNAEAVGTEILKSLVLPGLGNFTILDPATVSL